MILPPLREIHEQFLIDAPRINLVLCGEPCRERYRTCPQELLRRIRAQYANGEVMAYWCTQTALADIYTQKLHQIHALAPSILAGAGLRDPAGAAVAALHLIDDGMQTNRFTTRRLEIEKPFRLCLNHEGELQTVCRLHLAVHVDDRSTFVVRWHLPRTQNKTTDTGTPPSTTALDGASPLKMAPLKTAPPSKVVSCDADDNITHNTDTTAVREEEPADDDGFEIIDHGDAVLFDEAAPGRDIAEASTSHDAGALTIVTVLGVALALL